MATFLTILLLLDIVVLLVLILLLQQGSDSTFGGANTTGFFGASGGVGFIVKATWVAGILFFVLSLSLAWLKSYERFGLGKEVDRLRIATPAPILSPTPQQKETQNESASSEVSSPIELGTQTPTPAN